MKAKTKIIYIDDEPINLLLFKEIMGEKYAVLTVENGEDALTILENNADIDYVISDMNMPMMTGIEFIKEAKSRFEDKKYFILTGYSINDEIQEAVDAKLIETYWTKPADFDTIDSYLRGVD